MRLPPAWRRWVRRLAWALPLVALIAVGIFALQGRAWIAHGIAAAPNAGVTFRAEDDPSPATYRELGVDAQLRVDVAAACSRTVSLAVWLIEPKGNTEPLGTVLVLHGVRSDKYWLRGLATQVAQQGYRAVLPDLPGHGRSSGDWLTYGACEAPELKALLDQLEETGRISGAVGVVGLSYGAAVGIQLAAVDPRVRAVVAIAPFSSLRAVVPGYVDYYLPVLGQLIPSSFVQSAIDQAGALGKFEPNAASPLAAIARSEAPVLLIHGKADIHIAADQSSALHAAAPAHSELILTEGDDHFTIVGDRSHAIRMRGMPWLHRWLDASASK